MWSQDMDEASDEEGNDMGPPKMPPQPPMPSGQPPLPKTKDDMVVRNYDPKQARPAPPPQGDQWLISPLTQERIPAHKLQEHMKISKNSQFCFVVIFVMVSCMKIEVIIPLLSRSQLP